ncbi:glycoside hydrolase family 2 TIM barrel-domain containing protein [Hymenobacter caeli]|uniref:Beta-galactosidase n=1 Tax=Hymenobacter caeli TaxID=2735894 RepID=A0ABX2FLA7_9BACT|nr:glycoside hydrolase family 2 TIM barrel-domain containing protein [Hymenobacter caeli]NRT17319.1 beta-galactosidase [Hymenobacter caeli]
MAALSGARSLAAPGPRQRLLLDYGWQFIQADAQGADKIDFDDRPWRALNLPHDWSIEGEFKEDAPTTGYGGYLPAGIGWYRKHFRLPQLSNGQKCWVEFEGVYMNSEVWLNGHSLGKHAFGYTGFYYDLSPFLSKGENVIAVRVDNSLQPNNRWYSGSGIYRHVWLNVANPVHVAQWGTYITTPAADSAAATVAVRTTVENSLPTPQNIVLRSVVKNAAGATVGVVDTPVTLAAAGSTDVAQTLKITAPALWSVATPALYTLHSSVLTGKKVGDNTTSSFGIRRIEYDQDKGFLLNGKHVKMNGVCLHSDAGCLGVAVPRQAWVRRLQTLKAMGCNAIRTAHNPPDPDFLELCDQMGFLVMDEAFDEWEIAKGQVQYSYHTLFAENSQPDLVSMLHRDRNHPSIVIWSAGNEVLDQGKARGVEVLKNLLATFHREDPTRPVTVGNDRIADVEYPATPAFLDLQDVVGYNYVDRWLNRRELYYSIDKQAHPAWKVIGTENGSIYSMRGVYRLASDKVVGRPGFRPGSYNTSMVKAEQLWKFTAVHDYVIGDFMWTGIDHLGEAHWPFKSSSSGVIDLCGFPKDSYYFYQSQWTDKPMVHAFPHWNWAGREGQVIPVVAYTNCDSVELFVNGKSFGSKSVAFPQQGNSGGNNKFAHPFVNATTSDLHLSWDVPYEPGTLKLVGRKNGTTVSEEVRTTGPPAALRLSVDKKTIDADAWDIADVKVEVLDAKGLVVPNADNLIEFKVEGAGTLAGTDNGNPQDRTTMQSKQRQAFSGLALAVVRSRDQPGTIRITASSGNLQSDTIQLTARKPVNAPGRVIGLK